MYELEQWRSQIFSMVWEESSWPNRDQMYMLQQKHDVRHLISPTAMCEVFLNMIFGRLRFILCVSYCYSCLCVVGTPNILFHCHSRNIHNNNWIKQYPKGHHHNHISVELNLEPNQYIKPKKPCSLLVLYKLVHDEVFCCFNSSNTDFMFHEHIPNQNLFFPSPTQLKRFWKELKNARSNEQSDGNETQNNVPDKGKSR